MSETIKLGTGKTFTSSCTCRTKSTTISKQPYTGTRNYKWKTNSYRIGDNWLHTPMSI